MIQLKPAVWAFVTFGATRNSTPGQTNANANANNPTAANPPMNPDRS